jgi:hypothetical protein
VLGQKARTWKMLSDVTEKVIDDSSKSGQQVLRACNLDQRGVVHYLLGGLHRTFLFDSSQ